MKNIFGERNPNYKDGHSMELNRWKEAVKKRDNYECQHCHGERKTKRKVVAHHIKSKEEFPELIFDIDNGIVLCDPCHRTEHHGGKIGYYRGKKLTEDHKNKIAKSREGKRHDQEAKDKVSAANIGKVPWNKGLRYKMIKIGKELL